ncbi:MAG: tryptophan synthase subunit alpha [bacterium]|nr:tryptophan synthase subunit alpha [bacterium]
MGRLGDLCGNLRARGERPLVPFLTAGFPDDARCRAALRGVRDAGCSLVEIGVPFSDPVADGPVIQAASQQALARGMTPPQALELAAWASAELGLAVALMGYLNPVLRQGEAVFAAAAAAAGAVGVIVPDLPLEEAGSLRAELAARQVDLVSLVAPTTGPERLGRAAAASSGFLYLVSVAGVTGAATGAGDGLENYVARVRAACSLPLYVGFGVGTPAQAARVTACADGVIVGSALLRRLGTAADAGQAQALARDFCGELRAAMAPGPKAGGKDRHE